MKPLSGFDELRNDEVIIRNRGAKNDTMAISLYFVRIIFQLLISSTSQNNRVAKFVFFGRLD
jgi:hypothetical protein